MDNQKLQKITACVSQKSNAPVILKKLSYCLAYSCHGLGNKEDSWGRSPILLTKSIGLPISRYGTAISTRHNAALFMSRCLVDSNLRLDAQPGNDFLLLVDAHHRGIGGVMNFLNGV